MSMKGAPHRTAWTTEELGVLRRLYPTGGISACKKALPERTEHAIKTRASLLELKLTFLAKSEIVIAALRRQHPASEVRERRLARTARQPIDAVLHAWTRRRDGGSV